MSEKRTYYAFILIVLAFCVLALGKAGAGKFVFADATTGELATANIIIKILLVTGAILFVAGGILTVNSFSRRDK